MRRNFTTFCFWLAFSVSSMQASQKQVRQVTVFNASSFVVYRYLVVLPHGIAYMCREKGWKHSLVNTEK